MKSRFSIIAFLWLNWFVSASLRGDSVGGSNLYAGVDSIFARHCLDCHSAVDPEAHLILEDYAAMVKGGESGSLFKTGHATESLLIQAVEGSTERDGKKWIMPPGKHAKLTSDEIAKLKEWIDAGAPAPASGTVFARAIQVPTITPKVAPRRPVTALAVASGSKLLAAGRYGEVELIAVEDQTVVRVLKGLTGQVNAVAFSGYGESLFAAAGENALLGEVGEFRVADGQLLRKLQGHHDAILSLALSPDGKLLATGSYDQTIRIWDTATGQELQTLTGHNGGVFGLSFRPDGRVLASASSDRTVKLWDVATGQRLDTLSQALKEETAVVFSPDGKRLAAAGADNRIRLWEISPTARETPPPIISRFAHEGAILRLLFSNDGKWLLSTANDLTVKLWEAAQLEEKVAYERQSDWPSAIAFSPDQKGVIVGRMDGSIAYYERDSGMRINPPAPLLTGFDPRGVERGSTVRIRLLGQHLHDLQSVRSTNTDLKVRLVAQTDQPGVALIEVEAPPTLFRGAYPIAVSSGHGDSGWQNIWVDTIPQVAMAHLERTILTNTPVACWGTLDPAGSSQSIEFSAQSDDLFVFDAETESLGSKAKLNLALEDAQGGFLAHVEGLSGNGGPLMTHRFSQGGTYRLVVREALLKGSPDHFFRLSVGPIPVVTAFFPMGISAGSTQTVQLIGYNLSTNSSLQVHPTEAGEMVLPLDTAHVHTRGLPKLLVTKGSEVLETEPNDIPAQAQAVTLPVTVNGRFWTTHPGADADLFRFHARPAQQIWMETVTSERGSHADTRIEVLDCDGHPVPRLMLQATRDSRINFRGIDSTGTDVRVDNYLEMELNQYVYMEGEVTRLFRMPQGPDSGFVLYSLNGKRRTYFDTSATSHAFDSVCYIVEPRPLNSRPLANGLPTFRLDYANDDNEERRSDIDSRLLFRPPAEGDYLVRVTETRRAQGPEFTYRLTIREAAPDFEVTATEGGTLDVPEGSGQGFTVSARRLDGFDDEIRVDVEGLPSGWVVSTPLIIQAGHVRARGTIYAAPGASRPDAAHPPELRVSATAKVHGQSVKKMVSGLTSVRLTEKPKALVFLEPAGEAKPGGPTNPVISVELTIAPGETIPARIRVVRRGHEELLSFSVENLPHGVIVDNIGLNGVLIPKGQDEREIFLNAAGWVPETDRWCFGMENQVGNQTTAPVLLHVRKKVMAATGGGPR